jgi:hypothetical protein
METVYFFKDFNAMSGISITAKETLSTNLSKKEGEFTISAGISTSLPTHKKDLIADIKNLAVQLASLSKVQNVTPNTEPTKAGVALVSSDRTASIAALTNRARTKEGDLVDTPGFLLKTQGGSFFINKATSDITTYNGLTLPLTTVDVAQLKDLKNGINSLINTLQQ